MTNIQYYQNVIVILVYFNKSINRYFKYENTCIGT